MFAPLMAMRVPVLVSPIFMLEVSTAATMVGSCFGFRGIGWRNWVACMPC